MLRFAYGTPQARRRPVDPRSTVLDPVPVLLVSAGVLVLILAALPHPGLAIPEPTLLPAPQEDRQRVTVRIDADGELWIHEHPNTVAVLEEYLRASEYVCCRMGQVAGSHWRLAPLDVRIYSDEPAGESTLPAVLQVLTRLGFQPPRTGVLGGERFIESHYPGRGR